MPEGDHMPNEKKVIRKLKAILSADVKGYSLLMADDEVHTIQTLKAYRQIMSDLVTKHSGRVVDNPGDNLLAEFSSAVDAVECTVHIQNKLKKENAKVAEGKRVRFRIGVNIGDVVQDGDRIYGSGVNVAARIEGIADAGGVCISRSTYDQVKDKLDFSFKYLGEHEVKNIEEPVRVYKVLMDSDSPKPLVEEQLELPEKPSIAVLPFTNMSGDPSQEYFSDGLTEQIINGLSKVSKLFVIARNSSFAYKGKAVGVKQIAKELGVRYILEGSVQKVENRVRITAQLIDATTDYHMWSENFDRDLEDIFAIQDEITMKLIDTIMVKLTHGEQARLWIGGTKSIQAFDCFIRGYECFIHFNEMNNIQAKKYFEKAIEIDSSYAMAYVSLGYAYIADLAYGWTNSMLRTFEMAEKYVQQALAINDSLELAHSLSGWLLLHKRQHNEAVKAGERAIELNPNSAEAHVHQAFILCFIEKTETAIKLLKRAFRLNPIPPHYYYNFMAMAYRIDGQYEKAIEFAKKSISNDPDQLMPHVTSAVAYSLLNEIEKAKMTMKEVLKIDPKLTVENYTALMPYNRKENVEEVAYALRKAGMPEHSPK
jgi:adenylate cyclase